MKRKNKVVVMPVIEADGILRVVLVTSRANQRWILPKGNPEPNLTLPEVAAMEAWEEAGARGSIRNQRAKRLKATIRQEELSLSCFRMDVEELADSWPEDHERERRVVDLREARELLVAEPGMLRVLERMIAGC